MNGTNATTGKALADTAHLKQSITDILTTPIGSRVMRREYGSRLFSLIDAPTNLGTLAEIRKATVEAIARWEPRFKIGSVSITTASPGVIEMDLTGTYLPDGKPIKLQGIVIK